MAWLPNYSDKLDPGAISSQYHFQVHDIPGNLTRNQYGSNADQWAQAIQQIPIEIRQALQQKQSDEIANTLLQQSGAPAQLQGKGAAAFQAWQKYQGDQPDPIEEELLWKKLHPEQYPDYGQGKSGATMTPYQQGHLNLMQQREQRLGAGGGQNKFGIAADDLMSAIRNGGIHKTVDDQGKTHVTVTPPNGMPVEVKENDLNKQLNRTVPLMRNVDQAQQAMDSEATQTAPSKVNPSLTGQDQQAFEWATAHPQDPRSAAILQKLGIK